MKYVFLEFLLAPEPIDVGVLVCDPEDDHEVLGYMGETVAVDDGSDLGFPVVAQVNNLIKPADLAEIDEGVQEFIRSYLEDGEGYALLSRNHQHSALPVTYEDADEVWSLDVIEEFFQLFGVESEHQHSKELYEEMDSRAVRRCAYDHAEYIVYRNNLIGWASGKMK